jgi:hypothetical protein
MTAILNNLIIIVIVGLLIYFVFSNINIKEGMTTNTGTSLSTSTSSNGVAGNATSFAAQIKAETIKMQDTLLISKYRKDYETAIINLDDYIGYLMIKQTLNMNLNGDIKANIEAINNLNILKGSKEALNATMAFLDKQ